MPNPSVFFGDRVVSHNTNLQVVLCRLRAARREAAVGKQRRRLCWLWGGVERVLSVVDEASRILLFGLEGVAQPDEHSEEDDGE